MPEFTRDEWDDGGSGYENDFEVRKAAREPLFKHPGRLELKKRDPDAAPVDPDSLMPQEDNPLDLEKVYNPLDYSYPIVIDKLRMEVVVRFHIETLDFENKQTLNFRGVEIPFFPQRFDGVDPAESQRGNEIFNFYRENEHLYGICPMIVRAKVFGDGVNTKDVLVNREFVRDHVTPDMLYSAIADWYDNELAKDQYCPAGLLQVVRSVIGTGWRPSDDGDNGDRW
jgi:hypothetical protein